LFSQFRIATCALLCASACATASRAQGPAGAGETQGESTTTLFFARTGQEVYAPYAGTIHYLEFLQIRNRWILPDIGYIDFAHNNYREWFLGGGRTLIENKYASFDQELLYVGTGGSAAGGAKYLQPWSMLRVRFTPKLTNETVYFNYLPLNNAGRFHQVIERAKFEYAVKHRWKVGAGYAGVQLAGAAWIHKPMLTTTLSTKAGAFELWLQKITGGAGIELRYALVHTSR
jgi:hypothetical protein